MHIWRYYREKLPNALVLWASGCRRSHPKPQDMHKGHRIYINKKPVDFRIHQDFELVHVLYIDGGKPLNLWKWNKYKPVVLFSLEAWNFGLEGQRSFPLLIALVDSSQYANLAWSTTEINCIASDCVRYRPNSSVSLCHSPTLNLGGEKQVVEWWLIQFLLYNSTFCIIKYIYIYINYIIYLYE